MPKFELRAAPPSYFIVVDAEDERGARIKAIDDPDTMWVLDEELEPNHTNIVSVQPATPGTIARYDDAVASWGEDAEDDEDTEDEDEDDERLTPKT